MLCNRLWLMGSIYRYPKMASLRWCLNKLLRKQVISWKRTGEYCQSQESNKGKNSNVRVSSLYFRIWKKTCVTRLEWTPGGLATSHLFYCNHPSLDQFFISLWFWYPKYRLGSFLLSHIIFILSRQIILNVKLKSVSL